MAVAFTPGQITGRGDLDIFLTNIDGVPSNAAEITYAIYYVDPVFPDPGEVEVLIGPDNRIPENPAVGEYYAPLMVPSSASPGDYRIRWTFREFTTSQLQQVVQEFAVVAEGSVTSAPVYSSCEQGLINSLRILLRDQNPDKFYHFRPPEHEGKIGAYNRVFGQIWEDAELYEYLQRALAWWNMFPPATNICTLDELCTSYGAWTTPIMWAAIVHATFAVALNWVADEFDYSIGGVSLSIEKSSKYESLKSNAEGMFDKATEAKARTVKYIRGLQQPRFGVGVRSAFGPHVGRGVLSPRHFL
jgi:hypothetical protein